MTSLQRRLMSPHSVGGAHGAGALRAVAMLLMLGFGIEGVAAERDTAGATFPAGESAAKVPQAQAIHGGTLLLRPNPDLLAHLGLRAHGLPERGEWNLPLWPREPVTVELGDGAPTRLRSGKLSVPSLRFVRRDGARSPHLSLVPDGIGPLNWRLVDAQGGIWMRIAHAMRSPDRQRDGLRLVTADLRVGPALSAWTRPEAEGRLLANAALQLPLMPLSASDEKAAEKSCVAPNWPGVGNYVVDVELIDMDDKYTASVGVDVQRCRVIADGGPCDGPGGTEGEVVIVPSAVLRSRNVPEAADVPWHTKFSGVFAPYGNDQHPFLVWAMYRIDADGRIDQIGRSGLKHAFATANENCHPDAQCPANGQVLGRACEDTYNAGSNDQSFFLSPRTEIIPARGIWGRCGSVFDDADNNLGDGLDGCDGVQDAPVNDYYRERLRVRESDIDAGLNPGAHYLIDAWYMVRDDVNIFNSMGSRSLAPVFSNGLWNQGPLGAFRQGPVIDRWLEQAAPGDLRGRFDIETSEGHVGVAARVHRLPDGRYRYDYALMNFDFARAVVDPATAEPNLRVLRNLGFNAFGLALANAATVDGNEFRDGDAQPGNDWSVSATASELTWTAPVAASHDWGQLRFLRVVSAAAPGTGVLRFDGLDPGGPASYSTVVWVPDGDAVFRDGYE
jgi:hypothetical protein